MRGNHHKPGAIARRLPMVLCTMAACAIWSRFASPRAELTGAPSASRPNLFAGD